MNKRDDEITKEKEKEKAAAKEKDDERELIRMQNEVMSAWNEIIH